MIISTILQILCSKRKLLTSQGIALEVEITTSKVGKLQPP